MKEKLLTWWLAPNPEGVRAKDAVLIPLIMLTLMVACMKFSMWLTAPEQHWIRELLMP